LLLALAAIWPIQMLNSQVPQQLDLPPDPEPITSIPDPPPTDPNKLALGARLFSSPLLSGNQTQSCSSCHDLSTNGATGRRLDMGPDGRPMPFNTTTVFNAALSFRLGWEGRFRTPEEQASWSLNFMGAGTPALMERLRQDKTLNGLFEQAYGHAPDRDSLLDAIAAYERTLLTPGSRFDLWLSGDKSVLSDQELSGYRMFTSFGCVSCHQGVNVGGNLFQRHGIFHPLASPTPPILRVPSLRNVATTAPYFQDGSAPTLEDAVRKMGYSQLDRQLTDSQIAAIVAFLRTLTGNYNGKPVEAPQ
jgi:cytochrome c peroxidase